MTITLNVTDEIGAKYLLAARWKINDQALTDTKVMNKYLKQKIGELIDEHKRWVAVGADEAALKTLREQAMSLQSQMMSADMDVRGKIENFEKTKVPTDVGSD